MASRSALIPSLEMLPLFQCHHVSGRASAGGFPNPASKLSGSAELRVAEVSATPSAQKAEVARTRNRDLISPEPCRSARVEAQPSENFFMLSLSDHLFGVFLVFALAFRPQR